MLADVLSGGWRQVVQPRRDRTEHGDLLMPQLGVDAAFVIFDPGFSLGRYSYRGGTTCTFESPGFDHFFHMARVSSAQSPWKLHRTVRLRI